MAMELVIREELAVHEDVRGILYEIFDPGVLMGRGFGQIYCVVARPGHIRGNHRHHRKIETFVAINGRGQLVCWVDAQCEPQEDPQAVTVPLDGTRPERIIVLPGVFHRVVPEGDADAGGGDANDDALIFLALTDEKFNPDDPDTEPWNFGDGSKSSGKI
ncbi:MAG TPA: hypothetical protein DCL69_00580 [Firmicutes bacterium]|nr:hypothetical protein [Bacillota bacterium]